MRGVREVVRLESLLKEGMSPNLCAWVRMCTDTQLERESKGRNLGEIIPTCFSPAHTETV